MQLKNKVEFTEISDDLKKELVFVTQSDSYLNNLNKVK
jgi:hypothetical protein